MTDIDLGQPVGEAASRGKQLLVAAIIAAAMIVVLAGMFVTAVP